MTEILEIPPLLVKSGGKTINLTFKNDILSIAEKNIPSRNILEVELKNSSSNKFNNSVSVEIKALIPYSGGKKLRLTNFIFEAITAEQVASWVELVRNVAYKNSKPNKHLKFVINPVSGKGRSKRIFYKEIKPIFDAASCTYDITCTDHANHANELMITLDLKKYDAIVCIGGDGTMYEVINGILSREDAMDVKIPLGIIPTGSGNALNISLHGDDRGFDIAHSALTVIKGVPMEIDMCSVTQGDKRFFSFLTQSYGAVADCDLGTENMRWMGDIRFTIGVVQAILAGRRYSCEVAVKFVEKNKELIKDSYKKGYPVTTTKIIDNNSDQDNDKNNNDRSIMNNVYGTVNDPIPEDWEILNDDLYLFFCGKTPWVGKGFLIFPCALPSDGLMDLVIMKRDTISKTKFINILKYTSTGAHINFNEVEYYKIKAFRLTPKNRQDGYIGIDGERIPFEPFQVEILPRLITLLSVDGNYCHANI
ncbi:hypothetical protein Glove_299g83 [Diversispora epigaea]|uniref:DAGKc domain-containing protein n=1 Tax=Diversispora epigaea TaxID=1348612 RepID=A0A397I4K1_9GLOM|nr:hypothetical protein Glove_299g83 [Diversispora epigaea]